MTPNEYQKLATRTIVDLGEGAFLMHLENGAIGMSVESNEVLQHVQKRVFCGKPLDPVHLLDECGDVLWYLSYVLNTLGYTLEECMEHNLSKTSDRYPDRINKEG